jgi:hypothetical protein
MAKRLLLALVLACQIALSPADNGGVQTIPSAAQALSAFAVFNQDPFNRLDATAPFLEFIRSSGEVHIVLNEHLLAWMYAEIDPHAKAVLYAAYLGGNMHDQLTLGEAGTADVAGMGAALLAYQAIRQQQTDFRLPLFEQLLAADATGEFAATVSNIGAGSASK